MIRFFFIKKLMIQKIIALFAVVFFFTNLNLAIADYKGPSRPFFDFWYSATDEEYRIIDPRNYSLYQTARTIIDNDNGIAYNLSEAKRFIDLVLNRNPDFAPIYVEKARYLIKYHFNTSSFYSVGVGETEKALKKAIEIAPDYADAYVLLGHFYTLIDDLNTAEENLIKAKKLGSQSPWLRLNYASLLQKKGQVKEAHRINLEVAKEKPTNRNAYAAAADFTASYFADNGEIGEAEKWYKVLLEIKPYAYSHNTVTHFYVFKKYDIDRALELALKAKTIFRNWYNRKLLACAFYAQWDIYSEKYGDEVAEHYYKDAEENYPYLEDILATLWASPKTKHLVPKIIKREAIPLIGRWFKRKAQQILEL